MVEITWNRVQEDMMVLGFDCAHYDDGKDKSILSHELEHILAFTEGKKIWYTDDVYEELKNLINQILVIDDGLNAVLNYKELMEE